MPLLAGNQPGSLSVTMMSPKEVPGHLLIKAKVGTASHKMRREKL